MIEVNKDHPIPRQRFTIAHEIGHLIVAQGGFLGCTTVASRTGPLIKPDAHEEDLCNYAAAELLIPVDWARSFLPSRSPSFSTIAEMARVCVTSLEVAARRLVESNVWRCRLVWWRSESGQFRAIRACPSYHAATLAGMKIVEGGASVIDKVLRSGKPRSGTQRIQVEDEIHKFTIEAWKSGQGEVATLLIFERKSDVSQRSLPLFGSLGG